MTDTSKDAVEQDRASRAMDSLRDAIDELHLMKTSGIIEVAIRNPNVAEYMRHWEARAEAAEALEKSLKDTTAELRALQVLHNSTKADLSSVKAERDALQADNDRLREALKPFADVAYFIDSETEGLSDMDEFELSFDRQVHVETFVVAQFKSARAALSPKPQEGGE